jgi:hypothetical protein
MIESIKKQEEDILRILHQKRDQELEPLLEKLDSVEWHLENAQRVNVSYVALFLDCVILHSCLAPFCYCYLRSL